VCTLGKERFQLQIFPTISTGGFERLVSADAHTGSHAYVLSHARTHPYTLTHTLTHTDKIKQIVEQVVSS